MSFQALTAAQALEELRALGVRLAPGQIQLDRRDDRWLARLPNERLAWFAISDAGQAIMARERRLLRVLGVRCAFNAPRVLLESQRGDVDVRTMVPGVCDPWWISTRVRDEPESAVRLGSSIGALLAEQHTRVVAQDVADWLPSRPEWPQSRASIAELLPEVADDPDLLERADDVMARYEALPVAAADRVLVHSDVGFHNMAVDPTTLAVHGIFDWEAACWADRHLDFRYLIERRELLDAALAAYEPIVRRSLSRRRIVLYNAASAIGFLASRVGHPPDERWCGRTLDEDLVWTRRAIANALTAWAERE